MRMHWSLLMMWLGASAHIMKEVLRAYTTTTGQCHARVLFFTHVMVECIRTHDHNGFESILNGSWLLPCACFGHRLCHGRMQPYTQSHALRAYVMAVGHCHTHWSSLVSWRGVSARMITSVMRAYGMVVACSHVRMLVFSHVMEGCIACLIMEVLRAYTMVVG